MDHIGMEKKLFAMIGISVIISLIMLSGFSSTVSTLEEWYQFTRTPNISQNETEALTHLKTILYNDPRAFTIGTTNSSGYSLTLAATPYNFPSPEIFTDSQRPEIPLLALSANGLDHAYIYMYNSDFARLGNQNSWLTNHLLPTLSSVFTNDMVSIYNVTHVSSPRPNSDTHLIIPTDPKALTSSLFYAYDIISLHDSNYTIMFDRDQHALDGKTLVLSFDPPQNNNTLGSSILRATSDYISYVKSGGNLIVLNTNGYGSISNLLFGLKNFSYKVNNILFPFGDYIPVDLRVMPLGQTTQGVAVSGVYSSTQNESSIFIGEKSLGLGKITYVNIYPIISGFKNNTINKIALHKIFEKISAHIHLNRIDPHLQNFDPKVNFKEITGIGDININSSSIIFQNFLVDSATNDPFLLSYFPFDSSLSITKDQGKLGKDLVQVGNGKIVPGQVGNAIQFTGNNYLKASSPTSYNFTTSTPFSISFWIKMPKDASSDPVELVGKTMDDHGPGWHIWSFGDGRVLFTMGDGTTFSEAVSTIPIDNNSWQHIVCTYDGSGDQNGMVMYLNGSLNSQGQGTSDIINYSITNNQSLEIGATRDGINPVKVSTLIDDLRIYNTALSASKVSSFYQSQSEKTNPPSASITLQNNGKAVSIANVTRLDVKGYDYVIMHGDQVDISGGFGLYGNVIWGKSLDLFFKNSTMATIVSGNNKLSNFDNISSMVILDNKPIQSYVWQPEININGNTSFIQFLGKDLQGNYITTRKDINASGNISLKMLLSDTYSYASDISAKGPVQESPGKYQYDELGSFITSFTRFNFGSVPALVIGLLSIPFIVTAVLFKYGRFTSMKQDDIKNNF
jgi:hypothetical protein